MSDTKPNKPNTKFTAGEAGIGILGMIALYGIWSFFAGSLNPLEMFLGTRTCIGDFIQGERIVESKKSCPSLTKQDFIDRVNQHFEKYPYEKSSNGQANTPTPEELLNEIERGF